MLFIIIKGNMDICIYLLMRGINEKNKIQGI
jgi:2-hydroxy-3-keto-5-methylthiopentenyl-1-phosphate phosphatase